MLTPHEGEFERIFKKKSQSKILKCLSASKIDNTTVLFKGNDTVICFKDEIYILMIIQKNLSPQPELVTYCVV